MYRAPHGSCRRPLSVPQPHILADSAQRPPTMADGKVADEVPAVGSVYAANLAKCRAEWEKSYPGPIWTIKEVKEKCDENYCEAFEIITKIMFESAPDDVRVQLVVD